MIFFGGDVSFDSGPLGSVSVLKAGSVLHSWLYENAFCLNYWWYRAMRQDLVTAGRRDDDYRIYQF